MVERNGDLAPPVEGNVTWVDAPPAAIVPERAGSVARTRGVLDSLLAAAGPSAPSSLMVVDEQGHIVCTTAALEELFGYAATSLTGSPLELLVPWSSHPCAALPTSGTRKDGSRFPVALEVSPLELAGRRYAVVSVRADVPPRPAVDVAEEVALLVERQRIAVQLHDRVVPRLFAAGLAVSAVSDRISDNLARSRVAEVVRDLDAAIGDVRSVIFELAPARRPHSLRDRVIEVCAHECDERHIISSVQFRGAVDTLAPTQADALLAVLGEALSSVALHGGASAVEVAVEVDGDIVLRVDARGRPAPGGPVETSGRELEELAARARVLGGTFRVHSGGDRGSSIDWRVPRG
jgi:signal transduction histidine kinase